jgi:predicted nucleic acid-binding protein
MAAAKRVRRRSRVSPRQNHRYTIDASVFVNAFNRHEEGHTESLRVITAIQERGDPVIVPALLLPEVASAVARASDDGIGALRYANAAAALPNITIVTLTPAMARQAADIAATHRLRGADAVYVAVSHRYGTTLLSRDQEQLTRASSVTRCQTPEEALAGF